MSRRNQILFAPTPNPATLREQDEFTITLFEDGELTGDLCKNTTDLLEYLDKEAGIKKEALIDFCG
jgi:hypothetical protein